MQPAHVVSFFFDHWLLAVAATLFVALSFVALYFCDFRRNSEAPLIGGSIPVLGALLELMRQGVPATLNKYSQKCGDVFTLSLFGKRLTFVTNALMIPTLSRLEARGILSNFPTRFEMMPLLFGDGECRRDVVESYWASKDTNHVWSLFHGRNLEPLTLGFQDELISRMAETLNGGNWMEGKLMDFVATLFLPTTTRLFFGTNEFFQSREYVEVLLAFNDQMNALYKGKHPNSIPVFVESKRKLIQAILHEPEDKPFEAVEALLQGMESAGFNDNEKAVTMLSILWASNMNVIVSTFWALYYILNDPRAVSAIEKEIREIISSNPQVSGGFPTFTLQQLESMTVTESACLEAMRISSANILRTEAMEAFTLETHKGSFNVRKGDNIVISTGHIHLDPELFPNPTEYRFDRFTPDPVTKAAPIFTKDGQKCNSSLLVFSHGKHKCPGRFLAMNELKLMLLYVFTRVEIEFLELNPELDQTFYGVGSIKPKEDLRIRYRSRSTEA